MKRLLAAALLVCVAATGCGGSKKNTGLGTKPSDQPSSSVPSDLPSSAASIIAGFSGTECANVALQFSKAASAFSTTDQSTPYSDRFKAISSAFAAAAGKISDDKVKAAMTKLAEVYGNVGKAMAGVDYKPGSGTPPPSAYLAAIKSFGDPEFRTASQTMSAYFSGGCKG